ncbi:MAG: hypothetical protein ACRDHL_12290, partial [Candidatus Promineifilaceae bacterium]
YMTLLGADLVWVNRHFAGAAAGGYAGAVLLRRILSLLPGAAIVVMYPGVVRLVAAGRSPGRLIAATAAWISLPTLLLTLAYALSGRALLRLSFGPEYTAAAPLLGIFGLAMLGYGLASLWLNLFLATRPGPFVACLLAVAGLQLLLYARWHASLFQVAAVFTATGWLLALAGLGLYLLWLRPTLTAGQRP